MKLFEKIPENFFSILVSKNKNIYVDAIFVLAKAFNQEMAISKDTIVSMLISSLEDIINAEDFSEDDEDGEIKENNVSSKAYFLLRKLKWAGWIEFEMQRNTFEEYVILPDYSIKFITLLSEIVEDTQIEYNSYVFTTYSILKQAKIDKNETYTAVIAAYNNTVHLVNELKSLYNSLGKFHKKMINQDNINELAKEHFFEYKEYSDEVIFPRFTRDSVPRYKAPIKDMLENILADNTVISNITDMALRTKRYETREDANLDMLKKIRFILETYENMDDIMNQIEQKNSDYVRASIKRIEYLITSDKELKGKLVNILKNSSDTQVLDSMESNVNLLRQSYISKDSLYTRTVDNSKSKENPIALKEDKVIDSSQFIEFAKSIKNIYSNKTIDEFIEKNFGEKTYILSNEIKLGGIEDLILLILATIRAESSKSSYIIEFTNEKIINNGYRIPNMKFVRRMKNV